MSAWLSLYLDDWFWHQYLFKNNPKAASTKLDNDMDDYWANRNPVSRQLVREPRPSLHACSATLCWVPLAWATDHCCVVALQTNAAKEAEGDAAAEPEAAAAPEEGEAAAEEQPAA